MKTDRTRLWLLVMIPLLTFLVTPLSWAAERFELKGEQWTHRDGDSVIEGVLLKPDGDGPFPAVVVSHGLGGNAAGFGRMAARFLVKAGYVCIAPNYTHHTEAIRARRAAPPGGDRAGGRRGAQHPTDYGASPENVKRALRCVGILESLRYVDNKRIFAYGHSMGGFLTIALAAEAPDKFRAAAITAGGLSGRAGFPAPTAEVAAKIRTPFCILHGSADTTVRPEQSAELKAVLDTNKVPNERHIFEGVGHNLNHTHAEECARLITDWFQKHSRESPAPKAPAAE